MRILKIGDKDYEIHYGQNALCALEDELGDTVFNLGSRFAENKAGVRDMRALIWAGMLAKKRTITQEAVGSLIDESGANIIKLVDLCLEELAASFNRTIRHEDGEGDDSKNE